MLAENFRCNFHFKKTTWSARPTNGAYRHRDRGTGSLPHTFSFYLINT